MFYSLQWHMKLKKDWYKSKTMLAWIALTVLLVNRHFWIVVSEAEILSILGMITELLLAIGILFGRFTATKELK